MPRRGKRIYRMTISVPIPLWERMEAVEDEENWSAIACRAYETRLAELAKRKEIKDMSDVVARLRGSRLAEASEEQAKGWRAGVEWAEHRAKDRELKRLAALLEERDQDRLCDRDEFFTEDETSRSSVAQIVYSCIRPSSDDDRQEAAEFWEGELEDKHPVAEAVRGFVEGAVSVYEAVKGQL